LVGAFLPGYAKIMNDGRTPAMSNATASWIISSFWNVLFISRNLGRSGVGSLRHLRRPPGASVSPSTLSDHKIIDARMLH
jgi:hypothetical protein